jgi:hypothetical protein
MASFINVCQLQFDVGNVLTSVVIASNIGSTVNITFCKDSVKFINKTDDNKCLVDIELFGNEFDYTWEEPYQGDLSFTIMKCIAAGIKQFVDDKKKCKLILVKVDNMYKLMINKDSDKHEGSKPIMLKHEPVQVFSEMILPQDTSGYIRINAVLFESIMKSYSSTQYIDMQLYLSGGILIEGVSIKGSEATRECYGEIDEATLTGTLKLTKSIIKTIKNSILSKEGSVFLRFSDDSILTIEHKYNSYGNVKMYLDIYRS